MPIEFDCVHCARRVRVADALEGRRGSCPFCGESMVVPSVRAASESGLTVPPSDADQPPWADGGVIGKDFDSCLDNRFTDHRIDFTWHD